jgi:nucleotide-binding universal stress UspA family protein
MLVAFDGSAPSRRALRTGIALASSLNTALHTITVVEGCPDYIVVGAYAPLSAGAVGDMVSAREAQQESLIREAKQLAFDAGVELHTEIVAGTAVESIVRAVNQHGCDLLIIGLHHHPGLISKLTSHTAYDVAEAAPCSVLGVR